MTRGQGSIFKKKGTKNWHIQYYRNGVAYRETSGSPIRSVANDLLKEKNSLMARGIPVTPAMSKIQISELLDNLLEEYAANQRHSIKDVEGRVRLHLKPFFQGFRASMCTTDLVWKFINLRRNESASNATINRELAALKRAFNLAVHARQIAWSPFIPMLQEDNVRKGFVTYEQFEGIVRHLPMEIQSVANMAFITGWRTRSEVLPLQWRQVDLSSGAIRLEPGSTKNREGRLIFMTPELKDILLARKAETESLQKATGKLIPWVFHRDGEPIRDFRVAWKSACIKAGLPGILVHDLRRSATRNFEQKGIPRSTAMKITGHRTESVYRRYAIVSEEDLREAAKKMGVK